MNRKVCPQGRHHAAGESKQTYPRRDRTGVNQARAGRGRQADPGALTAVGLIGVVLAVRVAIAAPQLEDTVPVSTGELVGLAGLRGA